MGKKPTKRQAELLKFAVNGAGFTWASLARKNGNVSRVVVCSGVKNGSPKWMRVVRRVIGGKKFDEIMSDDGEVQWT